MGVILLRGYHLDATFPRSKRTRRKRARNEVNVLASSAFSPPFVHFERVLSCSPRPGIFTQADKKIEKRVKTVSISTVYSDQGETADSGTQEPV